MAHLKLPKVLKKATLQPYTSHYNAQAGVVIPKRVICALYDYRSEAPYQLSFRTGDYFHVIGNENDEYWWEATNPMTKVRGMVPASYFEIVGKKKSNGNSAFQANEHRNNSGTKPAFLGRVLYDFESESPEELSTAAGDHVIIVGQSNAEWLIAKPIGKLGGLGLVPTSYVEIKDVRTGQPIVDIGQFFVSVQPKLDNEHRKSKTTGVSIDTSLGPKHPETSSESLSPREQAIRAGVSTYFVQDGCYYFEVQISLLDGHNRVLYKLYEDFYDFHVSLLKTYPREAGTAGQYRIIPYMPGPVNFIDDAITIRRCYELNLYVKQLFGLPNHIQESKILREFFGLEEPGEDEANVARKRVISHRRPSHDDAEVPDRGNRSTHSSAYSNSYSNSAVPSVESASTLLSDAEPFTPTSLGEPTPKIATSTKIKIQYRDDLIAIRVSSGITFNALYSKISQRLGKSSVSLSYRSRSNEPIGLNSQQDLCDAWSHGKLFIYAS